MRRILVHITSQTMEVCIKRNDFNIMVLLIQHYTYYRVRVAKKAKAGLGGALARLNALKPEAVIKEKHLRVSDYVQIVIEGFQPS